MVIDLAILGMVLEGPRSAYDLQKDVEYHHYPRWTRISVPSVYRKVLQLQERGDLRSEETPGDRRKTVYTITEQGRRRFLALMREQASAPAPLLLDCNVVAANLNKVDRETALELLGRMRESVTASARETAGYEASYEGLPLTARTVFDQQRRLYGALLEWLEALEAQVREERGWDGAV